MPSDNLSDYEDVQIVTKNGAEMINQRVTPLYPCPFIFIYKKGRKKKRLAEILSPQSFTLLLFGIGGLTSSHLKQDCPGLTGTKPKNQGAL